MGQEMREIGELRVKILRGNAVLPMWGSVGATAYNLCAVGSCVIPSQGKGIVEIGLAVLLPLGAYAQIAPCSRLARQDFTRVRVGVVDLDYQGEM